MKTAELLVLMGIAGVFCADPAVVESCVSCSKKFRTNLRESLPCYSTKCSHVMCYECTLKSGGICPGDSIGDAFASIRFHPFIINALRPWSGEDRFRCTACNNDYDALFVCTECLKVLLDLTDPNNIRIKMHGDDEQRSMKDYYTVLSCARCASCMKRCAVNGHRADISLRELLREFEFKFLSLGMLRFVRTQFVGLNLTSSGISEIVLGDSNAWNSMAENFKQDNPRQQHLMRSVHDRYSLLPFEQRFITEKHKEVKGLFEQFFEDAYETEMKGYKIPKCYIPERLPPALEKIQEALQDLREPGARRPANIKREAAEDPVDLPIIPDEPMDITPEASARASAPAVFDGPNIAFYETCESDSIYNKGDKIYTLTGMTLYGERHHLMISEYDPKTSTYKDVMKLVDRETPANVSGVATAITKNAIYIFGGENKDQEYPYSNRTLIFDIKNQKLFKAKASLLRRRTQAAAAVFKGKLFVAGGLVTATTKAELALAEGRKITCTGDVEVWDFKSSWRSGPSLNHPRSDFVLVVLGNYLFAVGGRKSLKPVLEIEYYVEGGGWKNYSPIERSAHGLAAMGCNGIIYIIGGNISTGEGRKELIRLDFETRKWNQTRNLMLNHRKNHRLVAIKNNNKISTLLVIGGIGSDGDGLKYIETFDLDGPDDGKWISVRPIYRVESPPDMAVKNLRFV